MFVVKHKLCFLIKLHTFGVNMFGKKLKEIRKHLSVTQDGMAELMKIPARTYTSYERDENNPPYSMLVHLCIKYKINLNWFIANTGDMFIANKPSATDDELEHKVVEVMKKYGVIEK